MGLELFAAEGHRLPELTTVAVPDGVDSAAVRKELLERYDIEIGGGVGAYAATVWRIGLMGHERDARQGAARAGRPEGDPRPLTALFAGLRGSSEHWRSPHQRAGACHRAQTCSIAALTSGPIGCGVAGGRPTARPDGQGRLSEAEDEPAVGGHQRVPVESRPNCSGSACCRPSYSSATRTSS